MSRYGQSAAFFCQCVLVKVAAKRHISFFYQLLTPLPLPASQNHPVPETAEDQRAAAESDWGLWSADGHVLYGERGKRTAGHNRRMIENHKVANTLSSIF